MLINIEQKDRPMQGQFSREQSLVKEGFSFPGTVMIIGCGGIGNWFAQLAARVEDVHTLILFDDDVIEMHNLNRTSFLIPDQDEYKVQAIAASLMLARLDIDIVPINERFNEDFVDQILEEEEDIEPTMRYRRRSEARDTIRRVFSRRNILVVDCRDDYFDDSELYERIEEGLDCEFRFLRLAYNGMSMTVDMEPLKHPVMGAPGYQTIPSHIAPSSMVACLGLIFSGFHKKIEYDNQDIFKTPMTFNLSDIPDFLFLGCAIKSLPERVRDALGDKLSYHYTDVEAWEEDDFTIMEVNDDEEEDEEVEPTTIAGREG